MHNYLPFLKFKQNEIQAVFGLEADIFPYVVPLFDIPKEKRIDTAEGIASRVAKGAKQLASHSKKIANLNFFVDNHDLDDSIAINGQHQYRFILSQLQNYNVIPVMAFDRVADHNQAALDRCRQGQTQVGIRLQFEDFQSFALLRPKLDSLVAQAKLAGVLTTYLIFDCRLITSDSHASTLKKAIAKFCEKSMQTYDSTHYIVAGSVIPASIADLMATNTERTLKRLEDNIWRHLVSNPSTANIIYGDYGIVSPEFSELDLPAELMPKFAAPKVFYTTSGEFYIQRGGQFSGHPKGYGQYFDIADKIAKKPFYRTDKYSYGDKYIFDRSSFSPALPAKGGAPGSWIKATLSAHIAYVVRVR